MNGLQSFFMGEIARIEQDIARLEAGLKDYAPGDPRGDGQRALLRIQQQNRRVALDLAVYAADPAKVQLQCRLRYMKAAQQHAASSRSGASLQSDQWWDTLADEQYLSDLNSRLTTWLHIHANGHSSNGHTPGK